jgi:predicted aminopeptidase
MGEASTPDGEAACSRRKEDIVENAETRELEALRFAAKASRAIATLEARQKAFVAEISERKKRLRRIIAGIESQEQMGTLPLQGLAAVSVSDDDMGLVLDPLRRL